MSDEIDVAAIDCVVSPLTTNTTNTATTAGCDKDVTASFSTSFSTSSTSCKLIDCDNNHHHSHLHLHSQLVNVSNQNGECSLFLLPSPGDEQQQKSLSNLQRSSTASSVNNISATFSEHYLPQISRQLGSTIMSGLGWINQIEFGNLLQTLVNNTNSIFRRRNLTTTVVDGSGGPGVGDGSDGGNSATSSLFPNPFGWASKQQQQQHQSSSSSSNDPVTLVTTPLVLNTNGEQRYHYLHTTGGATSPTLPFGSYLQNTFQTRALAKLLNGTMHGGTAKNSELIELSSFGLVELDNVESGVGHEFQRYENEKPTWCDACAEFLSPPVMNDATTTIPTENSNGDVSTSSSSDRDIMAANTSTSSTTADGGGGGGEDNGEDDDDESTTGGSKAITAPVAVQADQWMRTYLQCRKCNYVCHLKCRGLIRIDCQPSTLSVIQTKCMTTVAATTTTITSSSSPSSSLAITSTAASTQQQLQYDEQPKNYRRTSNSKPRRNHRHRNSVRFDNGPLFAATATVDHVDDNVDHDQSRRVSSSSILSTEPIIETSSLDSNNNTENDDDEMTSQKDESSSDAGSVTLTPGDGDDKLILVDDNDINGDINDDDDLAATMNDSIVQPSLSSSNSNDSTLSASFVDELNSSSIQPSSSSSSSELASPLSGNEEENDTSSSSTSSSSNSVSVSSPSSPSSSSSSLSSTASSPLPSSSSGSGAAAATAMHSNGTTTIATSEAFTDSSGVYIVNNNKNNSTSFKRNKSTGTGTGSITSNNNNNSSSSSNIPELLTPSVIRDLKPKILRYNERVRSKGSGLGITLIDEEKQLFRGFLRVHMNLTRPINVIAGKRPPSIYDIINENEEGGAGAGAGAGGQQQQQQQRRTLTSFYMPRDTVKNIHITSEGTSLQVIKAMLKKFKVVDNPQKFALYLRRRFPEEEEQQQQQEQPISNGGSHHHQTKSDKSSSSSLSSENNSVNVNCDEQCRRFEQAIQQFLTPSSYEHSLKRLNDQERPLVLQLVFDSVTFGSVDIVLQENDNADIAWDAFEIPELRNFLKILDREENEHLEHVRTHYHELKRVIAALIAYEEAKAAIVEIAHPNSPDHHGKGGGGEGGESGGGGGGQGQGGGGGGGSSSSPSKSPSKSSPTSASSTATNPVVAVQS